MFYSVVEEFAGSLERFTRDDGSEIVKRKDNAPEWVGDICREAHQGAMPSDVIYEMIERVADHLVDTLDEDSGEEEAEEAIRDGLEADIYTHDLLKWLSASTAHVEYLDDAMTDYGAKSGFNILQTAQYIHLQEIANIIVRELAEIELEEA